MMKNLICKSEILEQYLSGKITAAKAVKILNVSEKSI
jgi:hypothetical protein